MQEWLYFPIGFLGTPETISSYGIIFFIVFGSVALGIQGWKIWKNKSGHSVSAAWTLVFFFMFLTYPIIGVERQDYLLAGQGGFRILFYLPILLGLRKFSTVTAEEMTLARILFVMVFLMIEYPSTGEVLYSTINFLGVFGVFHQGWRILDEKKTGVVSSVLLFAYAANATFWVWRFHETKDVFLFINGALFLVAYAYTICIWIKIRLQELSRVTA